MELLKCIANLFRKIVFKFCRDSVFLTSTFRINIILLFKKQQFYGQITEPYLFT